MIPATNVRTIASHGVTAGAEFGISFADSAHIMTILRDTLYSDKILAILREYSANAWDSHRMSGKPQLPIRVRLPTSDEPSLVIQDFGTGLSRDQVFNVYTQYGASTKRDNDQAVGMLGIGSKSGFAYSDTFSITSCFGGTKSIYSAMLDPSDKGIISLLDESPCGEETGIAIEIPIKVEDFYEFQRKARQLFMHFDPRPDINIDLPEAPTLIGAFPSGKLYSAVQYETQGMIAVMGCVPYRLNLSQVENFEEGIPSFMRNLNGSVTFDIGEVHVNASREELKYSDKTKRAIIDRLNKLVEEYVTDSVKKLMDPAVNPWQRRLTAQALRDFGVFVPKNVKMYTDYSVQMADKIPTVEVAGKLPTDPKVKEHMFSFSGRQLKSVCNNLTVHRETRIVIRDDFRTLKGYQLGSYDVILNRSQHTRDTATLRPLLDKLLEDVEATGVTIVNLSSLVWTSPRAGLVKSVNMKHAVKFFKYNHQGKYWGEHGRAPSKSWDIVERVPSDDDVYVEIEHFRSDVDLPSLWPKDKELAEQFGMEMPEVYAYKVTEKDPSKPRKGIGYMDWRKAMGNLVMADQKFRDILEAWDWSRVFNNSYYGEARFDPERVADLGKDHVLYKFLKDRKRALNNSSKIPGIAQTVGAVERIVGAFKPEDLPAQQRLDDVKGRYELFSTEGFNLEKISVQSDLPKWLKYIKLVDSQGA